MRTRSASLLAVSAALIGAAPASATTASEAIGFLNQQRAANAIPANVALDAYRTTGCANHNRYMAENGIGHGETQGNPGYTPEGADYSNSGEVVAQGAVGWTADSNPWDTAPLHQSLIFDPTVNTAGYDESEGFACMRFGFDFTSPPAPAFYAFTGNLGRTGVPPIVTIRGEGPYAPQEAVGIPQGRATGPNILFFIQGFGSSNHAVSYSLTGPGGPVEAKMVDSTTPPPAGQSFRAFDSGGDLIPVKPLVPLTDYDVSVMWQSDTGQQMPQTLSFKTGGFLRGLKLSLARKLARGRKAKLTAPFEAVGQKATVKISGSKKTTIVLKRKQSIKVPRPANGRKVTVRVSVRSFFSQDTKFTVTPAKRTYR